VNKKIILIIVVLLSVMIPIAKSFKGEGKEVNVAKPDRTNLKYSVLGSGTLVYDNEVKLTSSVVGLVDSIHIKEGQSVESGQVVLKIDSRELIAEKKQFEAEVAAKKILIEKQHLVLENRETRLKRGVALFKDNYISEDEYDLLKHEHGLASVDLESSKELLKQSQALLRRVNDKLDDTIIKAPLKGLVTDLSIKVGETAIPSVASIAGSSLMTISDTKSLFAEINIDEADIAKIEVGQNVEIEVVSYPDEIITGRVSYIAKSGKKVQNRQGVSFLVKVSVNDREGVKLLSGMSCRSEIFVTEKPDALVVPIEAIMSEDESGKNYIVINEDNKAVKRYVKIGISDDKYQEIYEGLKEGDSVVVGPYKVLRHLKDGELLVAKKIGS